MEKSRSLGGLCSIVTFLWLAIFSGCNDSEENPCKKEPMSAGFSMGEMLWRTTDTAIVSDTVLRGTIFFESEEVHDAYQWTVGDDARTFDKKSFFLHFDEAGRYAITLIAIDSAKCSGEITTDTVTQILTVVDRTESVVYGDYYGYLEEDPANLFTVSFALCDPPEELFVCMQNINPGCSISESTFSIDFEPGYRTALFQGRFFDQCNAPIGWIHFKESIDDVIIDYTTGNYDNLHEPRKSHRFVGKRIK